MPKWRHWSDSNQRSPVYETGALPLGHSANNSNWITITNVYNFSCSLPNFNSDSSQWRRRGNTRKMKSTLAKWEELLSSIHHVRVAAEKKFGLPGGESNPGLPRDRRGYSPLYYRGMDVACTTGDANRDIHQVTAPARSSDNLSYNSFASHRTHYLIHKHIQKNAKPNWPSANVTIPSARSTSILRQMYVMQQEVRWNVFILNNSLQSLQHPM